MECSFCQHVRSLYSEIEIIESKYNELEKLLKKLVVSSKVEIRDEEIKQSIRSLLGVAQRAA